MIINNFKQEQSLHIIIEQGHVMQLTSVPFSTLMNYLGLITMAKLCMAHASTHDARKPPGPIWALKR